MHDLTKAQATKWVNQEMEGLVTIQDFANRLCAELLFMKSVRARSPFPNSIAAHDELIMRIGNAIRNLAN